MQSVIEKFESSIVVEKISRFLGSKIYPVVMGAYILLCYYLGWDMAMIWFMALSAIAMLLTCKDMTPVFAMFLFMNIIISLQNSPSKLGNESNYFVQPVIYVQIIDDLSGRTLVAASSLGMDVMPKKEQAAKVGELIAKKAQEAGITTVVFDRNGYLYHGRVKEVADAARNGGLKF